MCAFASECALLCLCPHVRACMQACVPIRLGVQYAKCAKKIEDFFEDVFGSLEGDSGVCDCIFRTVCEGLLREYVCVKF